jgi:hypothetical protein
MGSVPLWLGGPGVTTVPKGALGEAKAPPVVLRIDDEGHRGADHQVVNVGPRAWGPAVVEHSVAELVQLVEAPR